MTKKGVVRQEWHQLLGDALDLLLTPHDLTVTVDLKVLNGPPRVDVLIRREKSKTWTAAQKGSLCDGIRDVHASHILIEFKCTENLNEKTLFQAVMYYFLYKQDKKVQEKDVHAFIVCSQTPRKATLKKFGFQPEEAAGVYNSVFPLERRATLIVLNDLADTPYNAAFKIFASRRREAKKAFETLDKYRHLFGHRFWSFSMTLFHFWYNIVGGIEMMLEMTREQAKRLVRTSMGKNYLNSLPTKDRLEGLSAEAKLEGMSKSEILDYVSRHFSNSEG